MFIERYTSPTSDLYLDGEFVTTLFNEEELLRVRLKVAQEELKGYTVVIEGYEYNMLHDGMLESEDDKDGEALREVFNVSFECVRKICLLNRERKDLLKN